MQDECFVLNENFLPGHYRSEKQFTAPLRTPACRLCLAEIHPEGKLPRKQKEIKCCGKKTRNVERFNV